MATAFEVSLQEVTAYHRKQAVLAREHATSRFGGRAGFLAKAAWHDAAAATVERTGFAAERTDYRARKATRVRDEVPAFFRDGRDMAGNDV